MKIGFWYDADVQPPKASGYYIAVKIPSLGDDDHGVDYYYYHRSSDGWYTSGESNGMWVRVSFWTDAEPFEWVNDETKSNSDSPQHPSLIAAKQKILEAIESYQILEELLK